MITNDLIGKGGRLGNQMFQYAALLGLKYKTGYNIVLEKETIENSMIYSIFDLKECKLKNKDDIEFDSTYLENCHCFDPNVLKVNNNTNLRGYFQTEKYFNHCKDIVKSEFTFKENIKKEVNEFLEPYREYNLISLHVRRTDYLLYPHIFEMIWLDYYEKAIKEFNNLKTYFIITSDDIDWCKDNFKLKNTIFSSNSMEFDLCLHSECSNHIITNSTFGWWGAWLGNNLNKKIIAPSKWFSEGYSLSSKDIIPLNWIKI